MMGPRRRFFTILLVVGTVFVTFTSTEITTTTANPATLTTTTVPPTTTTAIPTTTTTTTTAPAPSAPTAAEAATTTEAEEDEEEDEFDGDRPYYKNEWKVDSPPDKKKPYFLVLVLILGFTWAVVFSLATNVMSWCAFFYVYGHSYRIMWSLEEKLRIATKRLGSRKFGDDLMAQIRQMAPYDANRNDQEISTMLKSVNYSQSKPANPQ